MRLREVRSLRAKAKLNLYLDIVGQREDGYHLIDTVMQSIELGDALDFRWLDAPACAEGEARAAAQDRAWQRLRLEGGLSLYLDLERELALRLPAAEDNILGRAARRYFQALSAAERGRLDARLAREGLEGGGLYVRLTKHTPSEAGLGGASADAAALLNYLDDCTEPCWTPEKRLRLAAEVGADVPFARRGGTARCRGIGERMRDLPPLPAFPCVVVKPLRLGVKTAAAFKRYREVLATDPAGLERPRAEAFVAALRAGRYAELQALSGNVFATLIRDEFPSLPLWLRRLRESGSFLASLSGSGTACFALFERGEAARACAEDWSRRNVQDGLAFALHLTRCSGPAAPAGL